jgi:beta-glucosidase
MPFPKSFVWGAASSAYQTEGAFDEDGKGISIWDDFCRTPGVIQNGQDGRISCDTYHRYPEDVRLMKQMGLGAYRFSVSWPRIMPEGRGTVNEKGLAFYDRLVDLLLENGITPYMTLYHWDLPSALQREGGWLNRDTCDAFAEYASVLAKHFDGRVHHYITLNEPQCVIKLGNTTGINAPGLKLPVRGQLLCMHHLMLAHGMAIQALRTGSSSPLQVGIASTGKLCYPINETEENYHAARNASFTMRENDWAFTHTWCLDAAVLGRYTQDTPDFLHDFSCSVSASDWSIIRQPLDFIGANIYHGSPVDKQGCAVPFPAGYPKTAIGWPITPLALRYGTRSLYERYGLPILISENGLSCNDRIYLDGKVHDADRIDYLRRYLLELEKAINDGVDVIGYLHWCLTDNFEWDLGYGQRFGLIYIDYSTQRRITKDSAAWYGCVVQSNGKSLL